MTGEGIAKALAIYLECSIVRDGGDCINYSCPLRAPVEESSEHPIYCSWMDGIDQYFSSHIIIDRLG